MTRRDPAVGAVPIAALRHGAVRYGAMMLRRFGWFYHLIGLGLLLRRMRLEDHSAERIRDAAARGAVVYVLLRRSALDHLALNRALNDRRLPLSVWADGVSSFVWQPVVPAWRDVWRRVRERWRRGAASDPVASGWLAGAVAAGATVTLFVDDVRARPIVGRRPTADAFEALFEAWTRPSVPILLVPVVVTWSRAPDDRGRGPVWSWLEGSREAPSAWGRLRAALLGRGDGFVQAGEPVSIGELAERLPAERRARATRTLLRRHLRRESQVIRGPRLLPRETLKRLVLTGPAMAELVRQEARATGRPEARVRRELERHFDAIAANFKWWVIRLLDVALRPLWTRVFEGVDVREEDLERLRAAMRDGTAVLVPAHKSHFDYLLLSWLLYQHKMIVPHVVAGINLAIPGVAFFLRRAGGFFVKRSFSGDRLFPAVFSRYLRELIHQGYPVEFFIEGGRTRSGKLLPPKLGVLGMVMDAAVHRRAGTEVTLLPIALAYQRVAEEGAYARELGGEQKTPESLGQVVKASSVLRRRFGRLYVRVGEPIRAGAITDAGWESLDDRERRERLQDVGEQLIHRIGRVTVVLPSSLLALGLLAHPQRGQRQAELAERIERLRAALHRAGAEEAPSLRATSRALHLALERFAGEGLVTPLEASGGERVWVVDVEKRITLEFYKNQVLHHLAPAGLAALVLRARRDEAVATEDLLGPFADLVWTLRREFILDPERPVSALLDDGLAELRAAGALHVDERNRWRVADTARIAEVYALFRNFPEAYAVVLRHGVPHLDGQRGRRELAARLQQDRDLLVAAGAITRPESLSLVTLENAIASFVDEGVLVEAEGRLRPGPDALVAARVASLAPMVDPVGANAT